MNTIVMYPGTFDPITNGHVDLVKRAANLFEEVIVAIAESSRKQPLFSPKERVDLARQCFLGIKHVEVCSFDCLLINYVKQRKANVILRGLRAVSDFEYEFQLTSMNRRMDPSIETLFLMPAEQYAYISSSMVKEIVELGGDISGFVPKVVEKALKKRYC